MQDRGTRREPWHTWVAIIATLVVISPMLAAVATTAGRALYPVGDIALIDLTVDRVFTAGSPLLGAYSRFGWYHPGPSMYWLLAPFSLLAGGRPWGPVVGVALVQAGAIVLCARIAWRRSGLLVTQAVLLVQALSYVALRADYPWLRPWNPFVAFPFLVLFLLLVFYVGLGEVRLLPLTVFVATVLVQAHVGYALFTAIGGIWIVWFLLRSDPRRGESAPLGRPVLWSGLVVVVLWLPPLIDLVRHGRHANVVLLIRSMLGQRLPESTQFGSTGYVSAGLGVATRLLGSEFRWIPPWLGGPRVTGDYGFALGVSPWYLLVPIALLTAAFLCARRRRSTNETRAVVLVALTFVGGVVSLARLRGELADYAFYWRHSISVLVVVASVSVVIASIPALHRGTSRKVLVGVVALSIVVPSGIMATRVVQGDASQRLVGSVVERLVAQIRARRPSPGTVALRQPVDLGLFSGIPIGVFAELRRLGTPISVSPQYARAYLDGSYGRPPGLARHVWFVAQGRNVSLLAAMPGAEVIASVSPLRPTDEARLHALQVGLEADLREAQRLDLAGLLDVPYPAALGAAAGIDRADVRELALLNAEASRNGGRYAVVAFDQADAPHRLARW